MIQEHAKLFLEHTPGQREQAEGNKAIGIYTMLCYDFLKLTTPVLVTQWIKEETDEGYLRPFDPAAARKSGLMPYLWFKEDGSVIAHEGRHRAAAAMNEHPDATMEVSMHLKRNGALSYYELPYAGQDVPYEKRLQKRYLGWKDMPHELSGEFRHGMKVKLEQKNFVPIYPEHMTAANLGPVLMDGQQRGPDVGEDQKMNVKLDESLTALERLQIAAPVGRLEYVKERMAKTIWPEASLNVRPYGRDICHGWVSGDARKRMDLDDKIWIYGERHPEQVWHSVLTDKMNHLVTDSFRSKGHFMEHDGYILTDGVEGGDAEKLDLLAVIPVADLHTEYMGPDMITAFKLIPTGLFDPATDMKRGDLIRSKSKVHKTSDPRVDYVVKANPRFTTWYFYLNGECGAYVELELPHSLPSALGMKALGLDPKKGLVPHATAGSLQGLGYPSFVYQWALRKGYALVTDGHTRDAAKLWDRVAAKTKSQIVYVDIDDKSVTEVPRFGNKIVKVMLPPSLQKRPETASPVTSINDSVIKALTEKGFKFGTSSPIENGWLNSSTDTDESFDRFVEYLRPLGFRPSERNRSGGGTVVKNVGGKQAFVQYVAPVRITVGFEELRS